MMGFPTLHIFFLQIGDADEAEKNSPDEEAEKPDKTKISAVEKNSTEDPQQVESTQSYQQKPSF